MNALESLTDLFTAVDRAFIEVVTQFKAESRCGTGCSDCCHAMFDVSLIEAISLVGSFYSLGAEEKRQSLSEAKEASSLWKEIIRNPTEIATARIRCPLLSAEGLCRCYDVRPVNCRSYGVPTVFGGAGHVCGLSGFEPGRQYPTINLEQLQKILYDLSVRVGGPEMGRQRWPIAEILSHHDDFASLLDKIDT